MIRQYRTIKLPAKMLEAIESIIKSNPECGYNSIADFVKDSVRHHYCWFVHKIKFEEE
ncbi:MAG: hypothetical protein QMD20_05425 [Candidatus Bathyarchaeia archaeon]|nr:hypothetical protein [Candidatus Bathyarchaeia archaeon]